jgi:Predicted transcriptional regulator
MRWIDRSTLSPDAFVKVRQAMAEAAAEVRAAAGGHNPDQLDESTSRLTHRFGGNVTPPIAYNLSYRNAQGEESIRNVTLLRIDPARGRIRLLCRSHGQDRPRVFRADRILEVFCLVTGEVFPDAESYFRTHPMLVDPRDPEAYALKVCRHEVNLLTIAGAADGYFDPDEMDRVVVHVFDRLPDLDLDENRLRRRLAKLMPEQSCYDAAMWRMSRFGDGDAHALLRTLRKLIDADGEITIEEHIFAEEISRRLGKQGGATT